MVVKKARRKNQWRRTRNKARKRKRIFGMQTESKAGRQQRVQAAAAVAAEDPADAADDEEGSEDDDDDMPPLVPAENWAASLGQTDEAGVPSMAKCQLSGVLMHDPVRTPDGYLFERAALEDWVQVQQQPSNPLTGAPLAMEQVAEATDVAQYIQGYQLQMLSAITIAPEAFDEPSQPEVPEPAAAPAASSAAPVQMPAAEPMPAPSSLLGELPSLSTREENAQKKKEKGKIRIESRSVVDCPDYMRCAIDGKVMVNPVRSPHGHMFERKTLEKWLQNVGSVCPITQQALRLEECEADADMKKRIIKFLKGQQ